MGDIIGYLAAFLTTVSFVPQAVLTIRTGYTGAAAPEVSRFVAEPIEEAIGATPGLTELRSVSRNNEVTATARFEWGTDMRATVLSVRERLDAARERIVQAEFWHRREDGRGTGSPWDLPSTYGVPSM